MDPIHRAKSSAKRAKRPFLLVVVLLAMSLVTVLGDRLEENRHVRDFLGLTPFHSVVVHNTHIVPGGIEVIGEMVKRRCEFVNLSAYVSDGNGVDARARIDTNPNLEDGVHYFNRAANPRAQFWGPWLIENDTFITDPNRWSIYAHHQCPGQNIEQTNLFATGSWRNNSTTYLDRY